MPRKAKVRALKPKVRDERQRQLIDDAADFADDFSEGSCLIGYVIVAHYSDGSARTSGWRPTPADHSIGAAMWEAWIGSSVNKHFTYAEGVSAAHAVLSGEA